MQSLKPAPKVLCQEIAGESVLLDLASETYFGLNEIGTLAWRGLERGLSIDAIAAEIERAYDTTLERARADLEALIERLREAKLLVEA